ncbi:calcium-activated potassium channel subunit beta-1 [Pelodiscus sinensis]|uniref:Potassium calcium-activated channel subfamily M regulatory beta subunit 1 n=1 Tax=Pelodiscus sinensis TaxID=13735 RepID=K7FSN4_PELSI|nr:calcium-activated potassium channel subunit beta-1 [Pelodiscus sinensis]|eukprot:XP_006115833.1 calcium-activated potassium channel subunit beta-1 [Pelodiscus sinensis]
MLGKKLVTAQKRGETRALCLGLGMIACSLMMYLFIVLTIVPFYRESVWTKEVTCKVIKADIKDKCSFNSGATNILQYPCLEVLVDLNFSGEKVMLYHTEDTKRRNPKCSYVPDNSEKNKEGKVKNVTENFRKYQTFPCYYDPGREETSVLLTRLYTPKGLLFVFFWPSLMMTGGVLVIIMVKVSQYVSALSARQH